jgi:hypothetical protein
MTTWVNAGAIDRLTGQRVKTKAELRRLLAGAPQNVMFDHTALGDDATFTGDQIAEIMRHADKKWSVCGPDPYVKRDWWATVELDRNGNLKVS